MGEPVSNIEDLLKQLGEVSSLPKTTARSPDPFDNLGHYSASHFANRNADNRSDSDNQATFHPMKKKLGNPKKQSSFFGNKSLDPQQVKNKRKQTPDDYDWGQNKKTKPHEELSDFPDDEAIEDNTLESDTEWEILEQQEREERNSEKKSSKGAKSKKKVPDKPEPPKQLVVTPINILPEEETRLARALELKTSQTGPDGRRVCKFCNYGDGKMGGLSGDKLNKIYNMEKQNKNRTNRHQFIHMIVNTYNDEVYKENVMRNPELRIPKLTYDEYEYHLIFCVEHYELYSLMRHRFLTLEEESNTMRRKCARFQREDGAYIIDKGVYVIIARLETLMEKYLTCMSQIERNQSDGGSQRTDKKTGSFGNRRVYG